jgi:hypothetical protein
MVEESGGRTDLRGDAKVLSEGRHRNDDRGRKGGEKSQVTMDQDRGSRRVSYFHLIDRN